MGLPWFAAVLIGLAAGAVIGVWQGFWIAYVGIPAFIVTLAGMLLFRGLTLVLLTGGTINALPDEFVAIGKGSLPQSLGTMLGGHDVVTMLIALVVVAAVIGSQLRTRARRKKLDLPSSLAPPSSRSSRSSPSRCSPSPGCSRRTRASRSS